MIEKNLLQLYRNKEITQSDIAKILGVSVVNVRKQMRKCGLSEKSIETNACKLRIESNKIYAGNNEWIDIKNILSKEKLYQMYIIEKISQLEIGIEFGVKSGVISDLLKYYGITKYIK